MTRHQLLRALCVVLAAGAVVLIVSGLTDDRSERIWTGVGLLVGAAVCLVLMLVPKLRAERARLDLAVAHPDAIILYGQLDEDLAGASSALVADTTSVRVLATPDRAVRLDVPWREVASLSIRAQAQPGGEARALLVHRVAGETVTFWVERALTPLHLAELEELRTHVRL